MNILYPKVIKRIIDVVISVIGLLILSPIILIISLLVFLDSAGSIFYRGERTGIDRRVFRIFKFRTMLMNAENLGGHSTAFNDPRLTKVGKVLRKYKLDELPQLLNIILGDMSIVGPRPQVKKYTDIYNKEEEIILSVKPGLTDYASIEFINLDEILGDEKVDEKYLKEIEPQKNKLRIKYVKEFNFWVDIKIITLTLIKLLKIKS